MQQEAVNKAELS